MEGLYVFCKDFQLHKIEAYSDMYQDQGCLCEQLEQRKQDSTDVAEVQEAISEALVV